MLGTMIDREQNLRLGDARKLSQMMQGESVPSSGLSKQMVAEENSNWETQMRYLSI